MNHRQPKLTTVAIFPVTFIIQLLRQIILSRVMAGTTEAGVIRWLVKISVSISGSS